LKCTEKLDDSPTEVKDWEKKLSEMLDDYAESYHYKIIGTECTQQIEFYRDSIKSFIRNLLK
jgi:uncharacterized protein YaaR (DUF327 family)